MSTKFQPPESFLLLLDLLFSFEQSAGSELRALRSRALLGLRFAKLELEGDSLLDLQISDGS